MPNWNTEDIKKLIKENLPQYDFMIFPQGGSFDTTEIRVFLAGEDWREATCCVFGMRDEELEFEKSDDCPVDRIHCTSDSKWGIGEASPKELRIVADVYELLEKSGYTDLTTCGYRSFT